MEHTRVRVAARRHDGKGLTPAAVVTVMVTNFLALPRAALVATDLATQLPGTGWLTGGIVCNDQAKNLAGSSLSGIACDASGRPQRFTNRCWLRGATVLVCYCVTYGHLSIVSGSVAFGGLSLSSHALSFVPISRRQAPMRLCHARGGREYDESGNWRVARHLAC